MKRNSNSEILFDLQDEKELIDALKSLTTETAVGRKYKDECYTRELGNEHTEQILNAVDILFPDNEGHATVNQLANALNTLILSGQIQPKEKEEEQPLEPPVEDTRPRTKNGDLMSPSQIKWSEFRQFADSASMAEINLRKRNDPEFATFVRKNMEREMTEQPVGDGVTPEGQVAVARNTQPAQSLIDFARKYAQEPVANLRPKGGFITLAGEQMTWPTYQAWLTAATAAGAIR